MTEFRQPRGDLFHDVIGAVAEDEHGRRRSHARAGMRAGPANAGVSPQIMFDKIFRERWRYYL